jgi:hypothetical protein
MSKTELIKSLKELTETDLDPEIAHPLADELLVKYINDPIVTKLFKNIKKWYS